MRKGETDEPPRLCETCRRWACWDCSCLGAINFCKECLPPPQICPLCTVSKGPATCHPGSCYPRRFTVDIDYRSEFVHNAANASIFATNATTVFLAIVSNRMEKIRGGAKEKQHQMTDVAKNVLIFLFLNIMFLWISWPNNESKSTMDRYSTPKHR